METTIRKLGKCLTETKRKDFNEALERFGEFARIHQTSGQPTHVSEVSGPLTGNSALIGGFILYGVEQDGSLTWLGQIIDSSD